jgi:hypothetical protein
MKADKKCGNCEWWRKAIVTPNEKRYCFAVEPYEGDVMPCGENCVCKRWSANLDGAACGKCVYWSGKVAGSEFGICHKNAVVLRDYMQTCGDYWCGEFVPGAK